MVGKLRLLGLCIENVDFCPVFLNILFQASICTEKASCCLRFRHLGSAVGPRLGLVRDIYFSPRRYDGIGATGMQKSALEIRLNEI